MEQLKKELLGSLKASGQFILPTLEQLDYPEKVLQFGTGVLLRGLPDQYIDDANRKGIFKGRVVVVKSTATGGTDDFQHQDGLYTVCMRGKADGEIVDKSIVNAAVSRVLNASTEWTSILALAETDALSLVISNTTEVGIAYVEEKIQDGMPKSFPGKLLAVLHQRFLHFKGDMNRGLVILPAELVEYNGDKLKEVLLQLIAFNGLPQSFLDWFLRANVICNTLVDRIVPGKLSTEEQQSQENKLGYRDPLMIMAEPFGLWAIEATDSRVHEVVSFSHAESGCLIVPSIQKFKELKLRMLNAGHTFSCALSILSGIPTVREAMADETVGHFIKSLLLDEIKTSITGNLISEEDAIQFGNAVLDRFANPFLEHKWTSIAAQYELKLKGRCMPLISAYFEKTGALPRHMLFGFAAFLVWSNVAEDALLEWLGDEQKWGMALLKIPGISDAVQKNMLNIKSLGMPQALTNLN